MALFSFIVNVFLTVIQSEGRLQGFLDPSSNLNVCCKGEFGGWGAGGFLETFAESFQNSNLSYTIVFELQYLLLQKYLGEILPSTTFV